MFLARTSCRSGGAAEESVDLALDIEVHWLERRIHDPAEVLGGIETDQAGHDGQQRPVRSIKVTIRAYGPALQVAEGPDLLFPEDLEAPEMQTAQHRDRCAGIHPHDISWRKSPNEIDLAMRQHIAVGL
jgi:hypothetical protein